MRSDREYRYRILNRRTRSPLASDYYYMSGKELDTNLMDEASKMLIGEHDFASFVTDRGTGRKARYGIFMKPGCKREGRESDFSGYC